jgi:hypothetical protein
VVLCDAPSRQIFSEKAQFGLQRKRLCSPAAATAASFALRHQQDLALRRLVVQQTLERLERLKGSLGFDAEGIVFGESDLDSTSFYRAIFRRSWRKT